MYNALRRLTKKEKQRDIGSVWIFAKLIEKLSFCQRGNDEKSEGTGKSLKMFYFNANGILNKITEQKTCVSVYNVNIVCVN